MLKKGKKLKMVLSVVRMGLSNSKMTAGFRTVDVIIMTNFEHNNMSKIISLFIHLTHGVAMMPGCCKGLTIQLPTTGTGAIHWPLAAP